MHKTGVVLLWINLVLAIIGTVLMMQYFTFRQTVLEEMHIAREKFVAGTDGLDDARTTNAQRRKDLQRARFGWGRYWNGVQTQVTNPATGQITAELGTSLGLAPPATPADKIPVMSAFQPSGDSFKFVGLFRVVDVGQNQARMEYVGALRTNQAASWNAGEWRFRDSLPEGQSSRFRDLETSFNVADEQLMERTANIRRQQEFVDDANSQLNQRVLELNGDPDIDAATAPELSIGLIQSVQDQSAVRNAQAVRVQQMRQTVDRLYQAILAVIDQNLQLESTASPVDRQAGLSVPELN